MSSKNFIIADVFTEKPFGGNQLAVFTDGSGLDTEVMQTIAREMNYSETTFLLPPEKGGDFRVRIFTPASELPFAGHPIVGTGYAIVSEGLKAVEDGLTTVRLETGVGELVVKVTTLNLAAKQLGDSTMTQPLPEVKSRWTDLPRLAKALSLDAADIESTQLPVEVIYNGIPVMIIPLASLAALQKIKVDTGALEAISREAGAITVMVFCRETAMPTSTVHCRVFVPVEGIAEDPATGSANGPLGFYCVRHRLVEWQPTTKIISEQGFEMKRPSLINIELDLEPATGEVMNIRVGGGVVISGKGEIFI
ncbi:MAG: PhzF family phenazine biosynthesis protein [Acidobacteriota bacterium]